MEKLSNIFNISYGTKLNFNNMIVSDNIEKGSTNFVSRKSTNNGVVGKVKIIENIKPLDKGQITVSLGGTYVLSAFIQDEDFYTAQNVAVLSPRFKFSNKELFYYCLCISKNRFRYSAFGREANKTLKDIIVPSKEEIPNWINDIDINYSKIKNSKLNNKIDLKIKKQGYFFIKDIFEVSLGKPIHKSNLENIKDGDIAYVTRTTFNNGVEFFLDISELDCTVYKNGAITIGAEGCRAFFQSNDFITGNKVNILKNNNLNKFNSIFLIGILNLEMRENFGYGRAIVKYRLESLKIKLPVDNQGNPDWKFMENYIKSLPYSSSI